MLCKNDFLCKIMRYQLNLYFYYVLATLIIVTSSLENTTDNSDCDCGPNSLKCQRVWKNWTGNHENGKKCTCKEEYAPLRKGVDESCQKCDCGEYDLSCNFDERYGEKSCECAKGYGMRYHGTARTGEEKCEVCDCGSNGRECYIFSDGKFCDCQLGKHEHSFITKTDEKCKECDCGPESVSCDFNNNKNRICKCKPGYSSEKESEHSKDEYCGQCDCGEYGKCRVKDEEYRSKKECICDFYYAEFQGKCERCDCGFGALNCSYIPTYDSRIRKCVCKEGYAIKKSDIWHDETCEKCDCGEFSVACKFEMGYRTCTCKDGYISHDFTGDFRNEYCKKSWVSTWMIPMIVVATIFAVIFVVVAVVIFIKIFILPKKRNYQAGNGG